MGDAMSDYYKQERLSNSSSGVDKNTERTQRKEYTPFLTQEEKLFIHTQLTYRKKEFETMTIQAAKNNDFKRIKEVMHGHDMCEEIMNKMVK